MKKCPTCKKIYSEDSFYKKPSGKLYTYCRTCANLQTVKRQRKFKLKCIEYKGNKCIKCNYDKCPNALEFHHTNPNEKDFNISHFKSQKFGDIVKQELDKCILVCANCHREIHFELTDNKLIRPSRI